MTNEEMELVVKLKADMDDLKKEVESAKKQIENFSKDSKKSFDDFNTSFQKVGDVSKKVLAVFGTAVAGIATALVSTVAITEEYRAGMAKLNSAFEASGKSAEFAKETYNGLYRVLGDSDTAIEASNHLAQLNLTAEENDRLIQALTGVYATFGDSLPIEGLAESINHTAQLGEVNGVLADALEWQGINIENFNARLESCNSQRERELLILETLGAEYGEASVAYEKYAENILKANEAQAKMDEAMALFGEVMAPIMADLQMLLADILVQLAPYLQEFGEVYMPKIREVLAEVGTKIGECISFIADNWSLISSIGGTILAIATALTVVSTAIQVVDTVSKIMASTNPTVALITAIIAVIAILIMNWDKLIEMLKKVGKWFTDICSKIASKIEEMKNKVVSKIQGMKDSISNTFTAIKDNMRTRIEDAKNTVLGIFDNIKNGIKEKMDNAKQTVKNIIDSIKGFFNFKFSWPHIPMPHFGISPSGWKVGDLLKGSIPKLSISWYKNGGVFDNPTLFGYGNGSIGGLGEAGAEAIVPLEETKWVDVIADRLATRQSTPVVIEVDGKVFGKTAIQTINNNTKQTGKLQLVW